ncbi:MAG: hypothetical protein AB7G35_17530, partial [Hyphomicrobiaceae bacterium]
AQMGEDLDAADPQRQLPLQPFDFTHGVLEAAVKTDRRLLTRFVYDFPFYSGGAVADRLVLRRELIAALKAAGAHFVVVTNQQFPGGLGARGFSRIDDASQWPELAELIKTQYRLVAERALEEEAGGVMLDKRYRIYRTLR